MKKPRPGRINLDGKLKSSKRKRFSKRGFSGKGGGDKTEKKKRSSPTGGVTTGYAAVSMGGVFCNRGIMTPQGKKALKKSKEGSRATFLPENAGGGASRLFSVENNWKVTRGKKSREIKRSNRRRRQGDLDSEEG